MVMKNSYSSPKHGAGARRDSAYDYVQKCLKKMFCNQDKYEDKYDQNLKSSSSNEQNIF